MLFCAPAKRHERLWLDTESTESGKDKKLKKFSRDGADAGNDLALAGPADLENKWKSI